jgi:hypothetical protein
MVETLISCTTASCVILKLFVLALLLPMLVASAVTFVVRALQQRGRDARDKKGRLVSGPLFRRKFLAVEDVHRDFKTKTHIGEFRFAPGHVRLLKLTRKFPTASCWPHNGLRDSRKILNAGS